MYDLDSIYQAIILICGVLMIGANFLVTIDKGIEIWKKRNPSTDIHNRLEKHEEKLIKHDEKLQELDEELHSQLKKYADDRHMMLKCLSILVQNAGGDVDIDEIHKVNTELREHLIK